MKLRFSIMSLNLWNTEKLEERKDSIVNFLKLHKTDFICIQEIRKETISLLDSLLVNYSRVEDRDIGWLQETNIYYNNELFEEIEHGKISLEMPEVDRGLFYIRVICKKTGDKLLISTVHLTHQGNADEIATGLSYRHKESILLSEAINALSKEGEGVILCGDFNDPFLPVKIISEKTPLNEVFRTLYVESPITFPNSQISDEYYLVESIDKIMHNDNLKPLMATSPKLATPLNLVSDHFPVMAMFEVD